MITAKREHEICAGHRVAGHESKCAHLHGHGYVITFHCRGALDGIGRVLDFSVMKARLCEWLEENWDHRTLLWTEDEVMRSVRTIVLTETDMDELKLLDRSIVWVPFNPTAENMAHYLLHEVGPRQLAGTGVTLFRVDVQETRKCSATAELAT